MSFLDVWLYDSTPRVKVFLCYLAILVGFFFLSNFLIQGYVDSLYKPMKNYEINVSDLKVTVEEAMVSNVNGSVKGYIKNNSNIAVAEEYLKFEFYTPRGINIGTKYLEINSLKENEQRQYQVDFRYDNVEAVKISKSNKEEAEKGENIQAQIDTIDKGANGIATLLSIIFVGSIFI